MVISESNFHLVKEKEINVATTWIGTSIGCLYFTVLKKGDKLRSSLKYTPSEKHKRNSNEK